MTTQQADFDFDLLAHLSREAPAEFARRRAELIQQAIASCRCPEEGARMQSEIDAQRFQNPPGQETCLAIADRLSILVKRMTSLAEDIR